MAEKHALSNNTKFTQFPVDQYVDACIISYMVANIPPNPRFAKKGEGPKHSVKFLLAGYATDEDGNEVVVRKWTDWKAISYNEKSGLSKMFKDFPDLESFLTDDGEGGELWTTPLMIFLEKDGKDSKYAKVTKIKAGTNEKVLDITYSSDFTPYRIVKAFGNDVYLELAVCKEEDGIKTYTNEQMIDPPADNANN